VTTQFFVALTDLAEKFAEADLQEILREIDS